MKVTINKTEYQIIEKEVVDHDDKSCVGRCDYDETRIVIKKKLCNRHKRVTLLHELTHAHFYEYGISQKDEDVYDYDNVCEVMAIYADDIVNIANKYFKTK